VGLCRDDIICKTSDEAFEEVVRVFNEGADFIEEVESTTMEEVFDQLVQDRDFDTFEHKGTTQSQNIVDKYWDGENLDEATKREGAGIGLFVLFNEIERHFTGETQMFMTVAEYLRYTAEDMQDKRESEVMEGVN